MSDNGDAGEQQHPGRSGRRGCGPLRRTVLPGRGARPDGNKSPAAAEPILALNQLMLASAPGEACDRDAQKRERAGIRYVRNSTVCPLLVQNLARIFKQFIVESRDLSRLVNVENFYTPAKAVPIQGFNRLFLLNIFLWHTECFDTAAGPYLVYLKRRGRHVQNVQDHHCGSVPSDRIDRVAGSSRIHQWGYYCHRHT